MADCIFCSIASGAVPSKKVYEDGKAMAFMDINPRNPGHTLVMPKSHAQDIFSISEPEAEALMRALRKVAIGVREATGAKGISITQNNGEMAGQVVPHIHFHVIPRTEAEKGAALEGVLPVKQQDEAAMDSMARRIADRIPRASPGNEHREGEHPAEEQPEGTPEGQPGGGEDDTPEGRRPRKPEEQEIDFDF